MPAAPGGARWGIHTITNVPAATLRAIYTEARSFIVRSREQIDLHSVKPLSKPSKGFAGIDLSVGSTAKGAISFTVCGERGSSGVYGAILALADSFKKKFTQQVPANDR